MLEQYLKQRYEKAFKEYAQTSRDCSTYSAKFAIYWELKTILQDLGIK